MYGSIDERSAQQRLLRQLALAVEQALRANDLSATRAGLRRMQSAFCNFVVQEEAHLLPALRDRAASVGDLDAERLSSRIALRLGRCADDVLAFCDRYMALSASDLDDLRVEWIRIRSALERRERAELRTLHPLMLRLLSPLAHAA